VADDEIEHPLQFRWSFWYNRRIQGVRTQESYEKNIKLVGTFGTVRAMLQREKSISISIVRYAQLHLMPI